jgi:hypothetical protein
VTLLEILKKLFRNPLRLRLRGNVAFGRTGTVEIEIGEDEHGNGQNSKV